MTKQEFREYVDGVLQHLLDGVTTDTACRLQRNIRAMRRYLADPAKADRDTFRYVRSIVDCADGNYSRALDYIAEHLEVRKVFRCE